MCYIPRVPKPKKKLLRIVSWNINGLRAGHRKGFLPWLAQEKAGIVCVQETKIDAETLAREVKVPAPGHHGVFAHAKKKGYSGVATFSKVAPLSTRVGVGIERFDDEGRVVETEHESFLLFNAYFPKGSGTLRDNSRVPYKLDFYAALFSHVKKRRKAAKKPAIVLGDFNTAHNPIDLAHAKSNVMNSGFLPEERADLERHLKSGYVDTFRALHPDTVRYSWWSQIPGVREKNVGWRIDYVWVSEDLMPRVREAFIDCDVMGSDHCPVGIVLEV